MANTLTILIAVGVIAMGAFGLYQTLMPQATLTKDPNSSGGKSTFFNTGSLQTAVGACSVGLILAGIGLILCNNSSYPMMGGRR